MPQIIDALSLAYALSLAGSIETLILLIYAIRYYIFTFVTIKTGAKSDHNNLNLNFDSDPFVTVMLPTYNEMNVIDRLITSCTSFDFIDYEVIVIDDSIDESKKKLEKWKSHPRVKVIHRTSRKGWKGGALNIGLEHLDHRSTHVLILDADFIPPKDLLQRFLSRFIDDKIVAVQGYQVHDLNAEENWITKGVRVMFSVSNIVEMNAKNKLKLFLPLLGSVYMMRSDVIKKLRFEGSITEDWEMSLRLYEAGYKVIYDPTLTASAECSNTLLSFLKQNARWAEGHTRNFRKHFWKILGSRLISTREKIEFLLLGGLYLNSVLVVMLTIGGILILNSSPDLTYTLSRFPVIVSLLFTVFGLPSVVIAKVVALTFEDSVKDMPKILNALVLAYITTPVTAFASIKGLFTTRGYFSRTYKTGKITKASILAYVKELFRSKR